MMRLIPIVGLLVVLFCVTCAEEESTHMDSEKATDNGGDTSSSVVLPSDTTAEEAESETPAVLPTDTSDNEGESEDSEGVPTDTAVNTGHEDTENNGDIGDVATLTEEEPDINLDVPLNGLMTEAQKAEVQSFQEARLKFKDMSLDEFKSTYGPDASYRDGVVSNPFEATNMDLIREVHELSPEQATAFETHGFTVMKNVKYNTFFEGFRRIYSDDLPLYFSVDALLDVLHLSFDRVLLDLEVFILKSNLETMLEKMENALAVQEGAAESEAISQSRDDAAVWICVARSLLNGEKVACLRGVDGETNAYLSYVASEQIQEIPIFGKRIKEDFSQFKPRGHYTKKESLEKYFRSMMWIQRVALDFSTYSRHAYMAYLLTELLYSSDGIVEYEAINRTIEALVGISDSMNAIELKGVADSNGIGTLEALTQDEGLEGFVKAVLASGVANQLINSAIMASDPTLGPDEFTPIPPLFHFMGQRFIVDSYVFTNVTFDQVKDPDRFMPSPLDTWFVLGNQETVPLLEDELTEYNYQANLATLEYLVKDYDDTFWQSNFYNGWLSALMTLDEETTSDTYPPVMRTQAWQHRMMNSQLASWAHLRHDTILYAKQSYSGDECEYPDAWVDPYPEFFEKIADVAEFAADSFVALGIHDMREVSEEENETFYGGGVTGYFERLSETALMLKDIADTELQNEPLTEPQLEFMNHLIYREGGSGMPAYDGWYRNLIYKITEENEELFDPTIADIHTAWGVQAGVLHVGTGFPNLMLITVETNCQLRAYVGPVLSYHETIEGGSVRLDDETWKGRLESGEEARPAWTESFVR